MTTIDPNALYTVEQIAALFSLKPGAVRKWIRDGKVKAGKLGKSYLIMGADFLAAVRGESRVDRGGKESIQ